MLTVLPALRAANITRQKEWDWGDKITLLYRANELAGERGEACNIIKKLERERLGIAGSRATLDQLGEELADVVICADLLAIHAGIDLAQAARRMQGYVTLGEMQRLDYWGCRLDKAGGRVSAITTENYDDDQQRELSAALIVLVVVTRHIASLCRINLDDAIRDKFNATSRKVGLATFMAVAP